MDSAIDNGGFAVNESGKPYMIDGINKALQQIRMCLEIKKGSFVFLPSLGSELWKLDASKPYLSKQAEMFVKEAVIGIENIEINSVTAEVSEFGSIKVTVAVGYMGKTANLEVNVNGELQ